jgi:hypothetical protein
VPGLYNWDYKVEVFPLRLSENEVKRYRYIVRKVDNAVTRVLLDKGIPEAGSPSHQQGATEVVEPPAQVVTQKPPQEQVESEAPVRVTGEGEQPTAQAVPLGQAEPEPEPEPRGDSGW